MRGAAKKACLLVAVLALGICVLGIAGCQYLEEVSVSNYLIDVEHTQASTNGALANLNSDIQDLRSGDPGKVQGAMTSLEAQHEAVASCLNQLDKREAPESAGQLKADLIELYSQGDGLLTQLIAEGNYKSAIDPLLKDYETASNDFSAKVKGSADTQVLISSMQDYAAKLNTMSNQVAVLAPPIVYKQNHQRFVSNLKILEDGLAQSISGLSDGDAGKLQAASDQLAQVDASDPKVAAQALVDRKLDMASYNLQLRHIDDLTQRVGQDLGALRQKYSSS